jgi:hypothetical protein
MSEERSVTSAMFMDRSEPLGNSIDEHGRRALHALVSGQVTIKGVNTAAKITKQTVTTSGWQALPASPLAGRNTVLVQNQSASDSVLLNYDAGAPSDEGIIIGVGAAKEVMISESLTLYGRSVGSGPAIVMIEELA